MRAGLIRWAATCCAVIAAGAPAHAASHPSATLSECSSSVVFGAPEWRAPAMVFRATVAISCPLGVAFSAALRSAGGCRLHSMTGAELSYELFADEAMRSPVVSCDRATAPLNGTGRTNFLVYGRLDGPIVADGQFHDSLVTSIAP
jgi:hypothetical protein